MVLSLEEYLTVGVFHLGLVFARLSLTFAFLPGIAATYVSMRIRLALALAVTVVMTPMVAPVLPPPPTQVATVVWLITMEAFIGGFLGLISQFLMAAIHLAGTSISRDIGLMNAMVFDPVTEQQSAIIIGILTNVALVMIFITGAHGLMLQAIAASYDLFRPGEVPIMGDMLSFMLHLLSQSFELGMRLAAPFLVFAITFQVMMGVLARLSPQFNVFFVALPLQILLGLVTLALALPAMMTLFMRYFDETYRSFLVGL